MATATKDVSLNKKVSQFFWRSWAIQASWNYERQMNMGFLYGMVPTLDRLYPDESDPKQLAAKKEAYHRHMAFYNCTPQTSAFVLGPRRLHGGGVRQGSRELRSRFDQRGQDLPHGSAFRHR